MIIRVITAARPCAKCVLGLLLPVQSGWLIS